MRHLKLRVSAIAVLSIDPATGVARKVSDVTSLAPYGLTVAK